MTAVLMCAGVVVLTAVLVSLWLVCVGVVVLTVVLVCVGAVVLAVVLVYTCVVVLAVGLLAVAMAGDVTVVFPIANAAAILHAASASTASSYVLVAVCFDSTDGRVRFAATRSRSSLAAFMASDRTVQYGGVCGGAGGGR